MAEGFADKTKVVLGFSGGIDSVAAARYLVGQGYDVAALTLDMTGDEAVQVRARQKAAELGIEHESLDVRAEFSARIIDYFIRSYVVGETPAPCTRCNPAIKWRYLVEQANRCDAQFVATGHYFKVVTYNGRFYVSRAEDRAKDQSYYLWGLSQSTLSRVLTPMAHVIKSRIKEGVADKHESMGLCFLRGLGYREFIERHYPAAVCEGEIVDTQGRVVGRHSGTAFYTIGQKRGLDSAQGRSVVAIDAKRNRIVVGDDSNLYHDILDVGECNIVDENEFISSDDVSVIVRGIGRNPAGYMRRAERIEGGYRIRLDDAAWAPAAGQPVVFYRGDRVIGGGILRCAR